MAPTQRQMFDGIGKSLKGLREPHESVFRELADNFNPRRGRFSRGKAHQHSQGTNKKLLNARPRYSHRTLQSGMQAGITSPARPWFRLIPENPDMRNNTELKEHLQIATREIRQLLQTAGINTMLHTGWGDLGLFGHDCAIIEDDPLHVLRGQQLVAGEFWLGENGRGLVDTCYREIEYTIQQAVTKFVYGNDPLSKPDWSKVSKTIKKLWDDGNIGSTLMVRHLIMPRSDREIGNPLPRHMPIMSTYWEEGASNDGLLVESGYRSNPIVASRWETEGTNVYGSSPAMDALSDAKQLQLQERDKLETIRRMNRPPMNVDVGLRNSGYSMMPEAVNYMVDPSKGAVPSFQVQGQVSHLMDDIRNTEGRIDEGMYANLFLMIANLDRRQITAREIDERHEEKLIGLGPVLERQHREKLGPLLRIMYNGLIEAGRIPPLSEALAGTPLVIDYISMLAQAQKAIATGGIERLYAFVGNVSASDAQVLDKLDNDAAVDEYAEMVGVPTNLLRPNDEVDQRRAERQEAQQAEAAAERAAQLAPAVKQGADAARVLSETDQSSGAPRDILANLGIG